MPDLGCAGPVTSFHREVSYRFVDAQVGGGGGGGLIVPLAIGRLLVLHAYGPRAADNVIFGKKSLTTFRGG